MKYADAGVDVEEEERSVHELLKVINPSLDLRKDILSRSGGYSGHIKLGDRYLALSTDGVGTKTLVAEKLETYNTIGIDLVAMVVNDLICDGFEPIVLSNYIVVRESDPSFMRELGKGLLKGAQEANVAIPAGETAVHPNMNQKFDLGATALGIAKEVFTSETEEGDVLIGLPSSGIHSNGISLARKLFADEDDMLREVLTPTKVYVKEILSLLSTINVRGLAHITGGGFLKLQRIASGVKIELPEIPSIFHEIMDRGVAFNEMCRTYNMGIGFVVAVDEKNVDSTLDLVSEGTVIGEVTKKGITVNGHRIDT